ncbi:rap1 GTPase-activating protein 1-like isoform X1 [Aphidius gifuensis]|uniref:rap1 GTPase-activating protein 1-like isoform X1 n=1 Tax=Aphidius gifuensis TaxID=684658 RepID=UPI001CDB8B4C|nr:rap1 GTPase-activating protein 1-like isoform X1 [Aphidius gifuensis]
MPVLVGGITRKREVRCRKMRMKISTTSKEFYTLHTKKRRQAQSIYDEPKERRSLSEERATISPHDDSKLDFFDLLQKAQSSRLDDQRCAPPPCYNQNGRTEQPKIIQIQAEIPEGHALMKAAIKEAEENSYEKLPPLVVVPKDYWVDGTEHDHILKEESGQGFNPPAPWRTRLDHDDTTKSYKRFFCDKDHFNLFGRDAEDRPLLISIKSETISGFDQWRVMFRVPEGSRHELIPFETLGDIPTPAKMIRAMSSTTVLKTLKPVMCSDSQSLILKYDEHSNVANYKFGILHQLKGQITEEQLFGNVGITPALQEFIDMMGDTINLQTHNGYCGGLDRITGDKALFTSFRGREILFHVSSMLPHSATDSQQLQRKRHIGNDIVAIIFQEEATPFSPDMIASQFLHVFIVVQVIQPCTKYTRYKVSVTARKDVPWFGPSLPIPSVFFRGHEFKNFLLTKLINAETAAYKADKFSQLEHRTRAALLESLIEDLREKTTEFLGCDPIYENGSLSSEATSNTTGSGNRFLENVRKVLTSRTRNSSGESSRKSSQPGSIRSPTVRQISQTSLKQSVEPRATTSSPKASNSADSEQRSPSVSSLDSNQSTGDSHDPTIKLLLNESTGYRQITIHPVPGASMQNAINNNNAPRDSRYALVIRDKSRDGDSSRGQKNGQNGHRNFYESDDSSLNSDLDLDPNIIADSDTGMESMSSAEANDAAKRKDSAVDNADVLKLEVNSLKCDKLDLLKQNVTCQRDLKQLREKELQLQADLSLASKEILRLRQMLKECTTSISVDSNEHHASAV